MSNPGKGQADFWQSGDWNAQCFRCGAKRKASELKKQWQGYYVCSEHWEPRHPQDFVRGVKDDPSVPWAQPDNWAYVGPAAALCTIQTKCAIPGYAGPGCSIPSNTVTGFQ